MNAPETHWLLAAHAAQSGAHAVAALAPAFFKPATVSGLVEICAEIASAAPKLPFYEQLRSELRELHILSAVQ